MVKNKVASPFKTAEFDIGYGRGIDHAGELLDVGEKLQIISRKGNTYYLGNKKMELGREKTLTLLREDKKIAATIQKDILAAMKKE